MKKIVVQAGHAAPREPGFESGTGTVREIEYTTTMQKLVVELLKADGRFEPIPVPGDIPDGIRCDAAIFLHGDGSANPATSGYSFGYPDYEVNKALARKIAAQYEKILGHPPHGRDNYTGGLQFYYGYSRVNTPGPEVLFEVGFLTNPAEQKWIFDHLDEIAVAIYKGICRYFLFKPNVQAEKQRFGWKIKAYKPDGTHKIVKRVFAPKRAFHRLWSDGFRTFSYRKHRRPIRPSK